MVRRGCYHCVPILLLVRCVICAVPTCPGSFFVKGIGQVALTNAGSNIPGEPVGETQLGDADTVIAFMNARTYFAEECNEGVYSNTRYTAMQLLGRTLKYTTDVSQAGCGCNAALYLVSMAQNSLVSSCTDYYCDANKVCDVACAEVDIQEASKRAWHSTLHAASDGYGVGGGFGGGESWDGPRDFTAEQYGPGGQCIDTMFPFEVAVSFPANRGQLQSMTVTLTQMGKGCPLTITLGQYDKMSEIGSAIAAGMTPVISYWKSRDMLWMDGKGSDGQGPCEIDSQHCGDAVKFYGFSVEDMPGQAPPPPPQTPPQTPPTKVQAQPTLPPVPIAEPGSPECSGPDADCRFTRCCQVQGTKCYEKNQWWAACKTSCKPGIDARDLPTFQSPWSCKPIGKRTPILATPAPQPVPGPSGAGEQPGGVATPQPTYKEIAVAVDPSKLPANIPDGCQVTIVINGQQIPGEFVSVHDRPRNTPGGSGGVLVPVSNNDDNNVVWIVACVAMVFSVLLAFSVWVVYARMHPTSSAGQAWEQVWQQLVRLQGLAADKLRTVMGGTQQNSQPIHRPMQHQHTPRRAQQQRANRSFWTAG